MEMSVGQYHSSHSAANSYKNENINAEIVLIGNNGSHRRYHRFLLGVCAMHRHTHAHNNWIYFCVFERFHCAVKNEWTIRCASESGATEIINVSFNSINWAAHSSWRNWCRPLRERKMPENYYDQCDSQTIFSISFSQFSSLMSVKFVVATIFCSYFLYLA